MKRKLYNFIKFLFARIFGTSISISLRPIPNSNMKDPYKITYVQSVDLEMYLDMRQALDQSYALGVVDESALNFLNKNIGSSNWFIDVGANQGLYSCYILKNFPAINVLSIEPDPYNIEKLKRNLDLNKLKSSRVHIFEGGASSCKEIRELMLNIAGNRAGSSIVIDQRKWTKQKENTILQIPCQPLLDIMMQVGVAGKCALKIDIEGAEFPVLEAFFENSPEHFYPFAIVAEAVGNTISLVGGSVVELLIRNGYSLVDHDDLNYFFLLKKL